MHTVDWSMRAMEMTKPREVEYDWSDGHAWLTSVSDNSSLLPLSSCSPKYIKDVYSRMENIELVT